MKLKQASIYLFSFLSLCIMFSACYYFSYRHALNEFNKSAIERKDQLLALQQSAEPTAEPSADNNASVATNTQQEETVLPTTKYILEVYNMKTGKVETQELNPPALLVGLTRDQVVDYLTNYMKDMTLSEFNKGLISYELLSFSDKEITLRKSYNEDFVPYRFYVVVKNGYVVIYYSDLKSVYKYTEIDAQSLPEKDRIALSKGIYVNSMSELYSLLESYTS